MLESMTNNIIIKLNQAMFVAKMTMKSIII
jgi:hypothetical protein